MDPIKNQISAIDPLANEPVEVNSEEALARMLTGPRVFSDNNPAAGIVSLEDRRRRKAKVAGALLLGAAAVTAGVLVAANFGPLTAAPAPAVTVASTEATPTPSASVTPTPTATPSATPSAAPEATVPVITPSEAPTAPAVAPTTATTQPPVANPQKFTFPDGHLSFTLPVGWSVKAEQGAYATEADKAGSTLARVLDGSGAEVAVIFNGNYGDGTGGLVDRTIFDRAVVPGVRDNSGEQVEFGFVSYQPQYIPYDGPPYEGMPSPQTGPVDGPPTYIMDTRVSSELKAGISSSGTNQVRVPNGIMSAYAQFDPAKNPTFASPEAAKAWMGSTQYAQLKSLFLSLSYQ